MPEYLKNASAFERFMQIWEKRCQEQCPLNKIIRVYSSLASPEKLEAEGINLTMSHFKADEYVPNELSRARLSMQEASKVRIDNVLDRSVLAYSISVQDIPGLHAIYDRFGDLDAVQSYFMEYIYSLEGVINRMEWSEGEQGQRILDLEVVFM